MKEALQIGRLIEQLVVGASTAGEAIEQRRSPPPSPARLRLIERSPGGDLGAQMRIEYAPGGVVCAVDAPLQKLLGTADDPSG